MSSDDLRIPVALRDWAQQIIDLTNAACWEHLDEEYGLLTRRLVARLARKRPSPIVRGDARIWAAGAIYAVGQVNFLFDRSQTAHLTATQLADALGVVQTTMANKAGIINRALGIGMFEPDLTRVAMIEQHPMAWLSRSTASSSMPARCLLSCRTKLAAGSPTSTHRVPHDDRSRAGRADRRVDRRRLQR